MEGVAGLQPGASQPVLASRVDDPLQVLAGTGQHRVAAVVGPHRDPGEPFGGALDVVFERVPYDVEAAAMAIETSDMPSEFAGMLRTGTG